jgi:hypothetical protein
VIDGFVYIGTNAGHLLVLGDPSVGGSIQNYSCSNMDLVDSNVSICAELGYGLVPYLSPIVDFQAPDGGDLAHLRKEPVLSVDQVFISTCFPTCASTSSGHVYALGTAPLSIFVAKDQLANGGATYGTVTISKPAPAGGAVVALSSSDPAALEIPASLSILQGQTSSGAFSVSDDYSGAQKSATITASYAGGSAVASLLLLGTKAPIPVCSHCSSPALCCFCAGGSWNGRFCE